MKKAWTDLKSFITVITMVLFSYCIVKQLPIPNELQNLLSVVVGFFLGSKTNKNDNNDIMEIKR